MLDVGLDSALTSRPVDSHSSYNVGVMLRMRYFRFHFLFRIRTLHRLDLANLGMSITAEVPPCIFSTLTRGGYGASYPSIRTPKVRIIGEVLEGSL